jgi:hypothetical protein
VRLRIRSDQGQTLVLDPTFFAGECRSNRQWEHQRVRALIYFLHELAHVQQGIQEKELVAQLRACGAEATLMHVDLMADHVAALAVHELLPQWSVLDLKRLEGQLLAAFPVSPTHTPLARARKAARLVGLRLDVRLRNSPRWTARQFEGYAFAEYGPAGGPFLALTSGPPIGVVGVGHLNAEDAALLAAAADASEAPEVALHRLDAAIDRIVSAW